MNRPHIVADDAIPHLTEAFGDVARVRGSEIGREHLRRADAVLVRSVTRVDAALLEGTPVRFVGSATAGVDHVDVAALTELGVDFAHAPGCNARAVAEYVLAACGGAPRGPFGVIGHGQIGRRLTTALRRLGLEVLVCDPPRAEAGADEEAYVELGELLQRCSTVSLHVPRVRSGEHPTRYLLDAATLELLPAGATVINTSRGDVVDNAALGSWLDAGRGQAVLDVWEGEPQLDWSLLAHPLVVLATPHIAGYTAEGKARGTAMVRAAMGHHVDGLPPFAMGDVLPPAAPLPEGLDAAGVLRAVHSLQQTNTSLRGLLALANHRRPAAFEALRRAYAFRRELSAFAVQPKAPELWTAMAGLS